MAPAAERPARTWQLEIRAARGAARRWTHNLRQPEEHFEKLKAFHCEHFRPCLGSTWREQLLQGHFYFLRMTQTIPMYCSGTPI